MRHWPGSALSGALLSYQMAGGREMMEGFERTISILDYVLDTPKKRHITGGILLSVSMLFTGLALTVMTIRREDMNDE
ncbi:hypothetical protein [Bacteroides caecimuris]|uniref:hypothetical protein n=3 Tax=Bacteria TaxID=2 RepID=UPI002648AE48|nr:hypothetical protein [Bacteroides caecimuris]